MRPNVRVLDDALRDRILEEAYRLLDEVGIDVKNARLRGRLLDAGLPLDAGGQRVRFPRGIIEKALASAPSSIVLHDRNGDPFANLGGDRVHFVPGSSGLKVLDHDEVLDQLVALTIDAAARRGAELAEDARLA